jgi:hypothetical protein
MSCAGHWMDSLLALDHHATMLDLLRNWGWVMAVFSENANVVDYTGTRRSLQDKNNNKTTDETTEVRMQDEVK